ncbi:winged helix-turn-helix domain-containing protein [Alloacidobacterium sp.]|uniref:winged helix-turn-helix domain-containing protein n=1 Tax=Alloacidobacterium sp. TaxID=2951999 RepID=UPI002D55CFBE|nr:winged helix-turn-helix domain-containing protein [Alloacidobacterium sp.]HYK34380.1 winged helix-turn-helix domain-containing protein [Alloacidobacterium sp.]
MEQPRCIFRFADVEVDERNFTVTKAGEVLPVEPKVFKVLQFLLHNTHRVVTKDELLDAVWSDTSVSENSLTRSVASLRRLLGDDIHQPRFIATIPTIGYRFLCEVQVSGDGFVSGAYSSIPEAPPEAAFATTRTAETPRPRMRRAFGIVVACCACILLIWFEVASRNTAAPLRISDYTQLTHNGRAGEVRGTDGSRLYLQPSLEFSISQVSVLGGMIEPVPSITLPKPLLRGVSPDGSTFLIQSYEKRLSASAPLYTAQVVGGSNRYLADAVSAAWSPDGKLVAYSTLNGDINIISSDGTGAHKLASAGGAAYALSWSPDGRTIRFDREHSLWEITSSGSNLHPLLVGWRPSWGRCCGHWSTDGGFFIFLTAPPGSASQIYALDERRGLFRRTAKEPFQLTSGPVNWESMVFNQDGKSIFATGSTSAGELVRLDPKSNRFQPFLRGISADLLAFSKDGRSVTYVSYPDDILWRANPDGSDRVQLTSPPLEPAAPAWSPDGTQIIFMAPSPQGWHAWIVPSSGGSPQRLLPEDSGQETFPSWSPDGRKIIFSTGSFYDRIKGSDIRVLDLGSHQITTLSGSPGKFAPAWSPDGQSILAASLDLSSLCVFETKTQHWSTVYKGILVYPRWSGDGQFIYFLRYTDDSGILRIPATGGEAKGVVGLKGFRFTGTFGLWFGLDHTDAPLLLRDASTTDLYALTLEQK